MKFVVFLIIGIAVLGGAWWYVTNQPTDIVIDEMMEDEDAMMEDGLMDDGAMMDDDSMVADDSMMMELEPDMTVSLTGKNFEFSQKEIRVKEGDTVQINFTSENGMHDWNVDEFDAHADVVQTGNSSSVTFVADRAGTYEYYCSVGQHRANGMVGTLIVE